MKLDDIKKRIEELEGFKSQAVQELLTQRAAIDSQLRELGHVPGPRRGRRPGTKMPTTKGRKSKH